MRQHPGKKAFVSKEDLALALREATDLQPAAVDSDAAVHEASSRGEALDGDAPTEYDAAQAKVTERPQQDFSAITGGTAAAAEGGISHGAGGTIDKVAAANGLDNGSESEGVMEGLMVPDQSPQSASGLGYMGAGDAAAEAAGTLAAESGTNHSNAVLDGMVRVDEGAAGRDFELLGEDGGGIPELNDGFTGDAFTDWNASADDAMQFGAPLLPAHDALPPMVPMFPSDRCPCLFHAAECVSCYNKTGSLCRWAVTLVRRPSCV